MTNHPEEPRELRRDLYRELTVWLRRQNEAQKSDSFWDRPIAITLISSVFLGLLTTGWQIVEKRRQVDLVYEQNLIKERAQLLKELPRTYEAIGQTINSWFETVLWIAGETNKPPTAKTAENIAEWKGKTWDFEATYAKVEPLDGVLARIGVLYACPSVRSSAQALSAQWREFVDAFQALNRRWNDSQQLPRADIEAAEDDRRTRLVRLEAAKRGLIDKMTRELFYSRDEVEHCPT